MKNHLVQAAERGDAAAQFNLAIIYENGLDDSRYAVEGNRPEAMRWLLAAAEQGLPRAQIKLAEIYAGEPEFPEVGKGLRVVSAGDDKPVGAHLKRLSPPTSAPALRLTPAQIAERDELVPKAGSRKGRPRLPRWISE